MTRPDDSQAVTRPISVAELLAKNGSIGSPPVGGGRRRRRRGKGDAVSVAELTGEIPVFDDEFLAQDEAARTSGGNGSDDSRTIDHHSPQFSHDPMPRRGRDAEPQRSNYPRPMRQGDAEEPQAAPAAEAMSPDPIDDAMDVVYQSAADEASAVYVTEADGLGIGEVTYARDHVPVGAVREDDDALFSGDTVAEDIAGGIPAIEPIAGDLSDDLVDADRSASEDSGAPLREEDYGADYDEDYGYAERPSRARVIVRGLAIALESVVAVVFGAGLFLAFDQLWQWNSLVTMVLAILATLGLVAGVWVVRKTEDIASTLIAVGVGLLVTFGPLALMHAN